MEYLKSHRRRDRSGLAPPKTIQNVCIRSTKQLINSIILSIRNAVEDIVNHPIERSARWHSGKRPLTLTPFSNQKQMNFYNRSCSLKSASGKRYHGPECSARQPMNTSATMASIVHASWSDGTIDPENT